VAHPRNGRRCAAQALPVGQRAERGGITTSETDLGGPFDLFAQQLAQHEVTALDGAGHVFVRCRRQKASLLQHAERPVPRQRRARPVAVQAVKLAISGPTEAKPPAKSACTEAPPFTITSST